MIKTLNKKLKRFISVFLCLYVTFSCSSSTYIAIEGVTEIEEAGTYPVTYWSYDESTGQYAEITKYVIIERSRTIINEYVGEAIDAIDFITEKPLSSFSDSEIITKSHAHAWEIANGNPIDIVKVTVEMINQDAGIYSITFLTANGTATTITVLESKENVILSPDISINKIGNETAITKWTHYIFWPMMLIFAMILALFPYTLHKKRQAETVLFQVYEDDEIK